MGKRILIASGGGIDQIFQLRHPRTGEPAQFTISQDKVLLEIQHVDGSEYSWFLDESIVSDGGMYLCSPVDPLFVVLHALEKARNKTEDSEGRFTLFEDCLVDQEFPAIKLLGSVKGCALEKICDVNEKFAPDMYIRLSDQKVLSWLQTKVHGVAAHLVAKTGDATVSTFNDAQFDKTSAAPAVPVITDGEREFAAGIVSEYLSASWTARLCEAAGLRNILESAPAAPVTYTPVPSREDLLPKEDTQKKRAAPAMSLGARKLAKVTSRELKGMKPMASFFKPKTKS